MKKLAFFLSGRGSTLMNMLSKMPELGMDARFELVISSRPGVGGLEIAREFGIRAEVMRRRDYPSTEKYSEAITALLDECGIDYGVFGGFMCRYLPPLKYRNRILNVHPALIPAFCGQGMYGGHVHEAVLEYGVKLSGCTVHFVDDEYDAGPVVAQQAVEVRDDDTVESLAARVQAVERELLPLCVKLLVDGRLRVEGRRVFVSPEKVEE